MANGSTAAGQLQRAGVSRLVAGKRKKRLKKLLASHRIRETAVRNPFVEQGKDEKAQKGVPKNRVYLVTVIEEGLGNSKDKNYYSGDALRNGINVFNGSKAYSDHPDAITEKTLPERSMKDLVGWYSDCFTDKNPETGKIRLRGKLHFFPDARWLTDKIDTILKDPSAKGLFGISINAIGKTRPATMQGEEVNYVEEFQRVDSADVVTEPAARGKFDQMLESRRGMSRSGSKVSSSMAKSKRTREAGAISSEKAKEVADSLVSAYNSDNPDEAKQAMFEAAKVLHAAASISGKGPGQVNEEQYSNINPSGGAEDMKKQNVRASVGDRRPVRFRRKKALRAAAGTGEDNEDVGEPTDSDIEPHLEEASEADVEDEEGKGDLGEQSQFGGGSKYRTVKASRRARAQEALEDEDEGLEDEDEGFEDEDEDEDEDVGQAPGGSTSVGHSPAAPAGGGAPGSSRAMASEADDDDYDDEDDEDDMDDMDEADESMEDEDEDEDEHDMMRPGNVAESRRARTSRRQRGREASFSGGLGDSGHKALPKGVDDTKGYTDRDEEYGKKDGSTSGVGKSYKIKTSRFARNRKARKIARPIVREANRRIAKLENMVSRLRESLRSKDRKVTHYSGKVRFMESKQTATALLREAIHDDLLTPGYAQAIARDLYGLSRPEQIREIKKHAHLLEAATNESVSRLTESVDGNGARGVAVSWRPDGNADSELVSALAEEGVPMKEEKQ